MGVTKDFDAEKVQANKSVESETNLREETPDVGKIYCFGDSKTFFKFSIGPMLWHFYKLHERDSPFEGNLRYFGACFIPERKVLITGGVYTTTL